MSTATPARVATVGAGAGLLVAVLLVALNLRIAVTSLGALLDPIHAATGMSTATAAALTSLPVLCFALVGATGMRLARTVGIHRGIGVALGLLAAGLLLRVADGPVVLLLGTFVACAGIALANVLVPAVVKQHFPDRVGAVTGAYSAVLSVGGALGAAASVPAAAALGGWRPGLAVWAAAALVALAVWWPHCRDRDPQATRQARPSLLRNPTAWALTVLFATQSLFAYVGMSWLPTIYADAGFSHQTAGMLLSFCILLGVPIFWAVPMVAVRLRSQGHLAAGLTLLLVAGFTGLWLAPVGGAWLWAALIGIGSGVFPLSLTMFSLRTSDPQDTASLSAMAQSIGYLLAAPGPFLIGMLHDVTGSWSAPIVTLLGVMAVQVVAGYVAGRPVVIDTER